MELSPGEDEAELPATQAAIDDLEVVDPDLGFPSAWRAWKCGKP